MKIIILCIMLFLLTACSQFSKDEQVKTLVLSNSSAHWKNIYNDGDALFENNEIHIISKQNWFFLTKNK